MIFTFSGKSLQSKIVLTSRNIISSHFHSCLRIIILFFMFSVEFYFRLAILEGSNSKISKMEKNSGIAHSGLLEI